MSLEKYNQTIFSQFIDYNSVEVAVLADNLFEKLRQQGILPTYIERDSDSRIKINIVVALLTSMSDFTFSKAMSSPIFLNGYLKLNRDFILDFEMKVPSSFGIVFLDTVVLTQSTIAVNSETFYFSTNIGAGFHKIKLEVSSNNFNLYVNSILFYSFKTATIPEFNNSLVLLSILTSNTYYGNILIRDIGNKILHYWKISFEGIEGTDSGEGDYAFYSFWYSTCYTIALINKYREKLLQINNDEFMLGRFLFEEKGIAIRN